MKRILFLILLLVSVRANGQDTLKLVNQSVLTVKVLEVGLDIIKYKPWGMDEAPLVVVEKKDVLSIVFANGEKMEFKPDPLLVSNIQSRATGKNSALKVEFLATLTNDFTICYERVIRPSVNMEGKLGLIGIGVTESNKHPSGLFGKLGPKFWTGSDYYVRGMRMSHPLRGWYVKPELIFSQFKQDETWYNYATGNNISGRYTYTSLALDICFGRQILLADIMTFDWYFGVGYGTQFTNAPENTSNYYGTLDSPFAYYAYSHLFLGRNFPMVLSTGITIGILMW